MQASQVTMVMLPVCPPQGTEGPQLPAQKVPITGPVPLASVLQLTELGRAVSLDPDLQGAIGSSRLYQNRPTQKELAEPFTSGKQLFWKPGLPTRSRPGGNTVFLFCSVENAFIAPVSLPESFLYCHLCCKSTWYFRLAPHTRGRHCGQ